MKTAYTYHHSMLLSCLTHCLFWLWYWRKERVLPSIWMTQWIWDLKNEGLTDVFAPEFLRFWYCFSPHDHKLTFIGKNHILYCKLFRKIRKRVALNYHSSWGSVSKDIFLCRTRLYFLNELQNYLHLECINLCHGIAWSA